MMYCSLFVPFFAHLNQSRFVCMLIYLLRFLCVQYTNQWWKVTLRKVEWVLKVFFFFFFFECLKFRGHFLLTFDIFLVLQMTFTETKSSSVIRTWRQTQRSTTKKETFFSDKKTLYHEIKYVHWIETFLRNEN